MVIKCVVKTGACLSPRLAENTRDEPFHEVSMAKERGAPLHFARARLRLKELMIPKAVSRLSLFHLQAASRKLLSSGMADAELEALKAEVKGLSQEVSVSVGQALKLAEQYLSLVQKLESKTGPVDELFCKHILVLIGNKEARSSYKKLKDRTSEIRAAAITVKDIFSSIEGRSKRRSRQPYGSDAHNSFLNGIAACEYYLKSAMVRVYSAKPEDKVAKGLADSGVLHDFITAGVRDDENLKAQAIAILMDFRKHDLDNIKAFVDKENFEEAEKLWREFEKAGIS